MVYFHVDPNYSKSLQLQTKFYSLNIAHVLDWIDKGKRPFNVNVTGDKALTDYLNSTSEEGKKVKDVTVHYSSNGHYDSFLVVYDDGSTRNRYDIPKSIIKDIEKSIYYIK